MKLREFKEIAVATTSVEVFIRPLEVTVPADFIYTTTSTTPAAPASENPDQPRTFWSTMTSRIETETSIKRWSIPPVTTVEGNPPGPEDHPSTKQGSEHEGRVIGITPNYKIGEGVPKQELNLGKSGFLPNGTGDYKVSTLQETYKQTFIDPKVSMSNLYSVRGKKYI
uniref:Uncharacterized protein n=1 Tax=Caenorhabditis angaria TaxID=860376 RepID=B6VBW4_9PELO|nr:hypothetical protein Csp3_JD04.006 [Caenorhabditis angaria]